MTLAEIDALLAGRDLDALVAERVMGWLKVEPAVNYDVAHGCPPGFGKRADDKREFCPRYSRDIAAAWDITPILERHKPFPQYLEVSARYSDAPWVAKVFEGSVMVAEAYGETAPLAICRAALKAVGA